MQRAILITAAAPGKSADSKLTVASDYLHSLRVFERNWKRTTQIFFLLFPEISETKSMSNHKWVCNPPHSLFCWEPPRAREHNRTERRRARAEHVLSLGIKPCTRSKMKLALSGLSNRERELFHYCARTRDFNHCHTINYKLIVLKKKKNGGWKPPQHLFFTDFASFLPFFRIIFIHFLFSLYWYHLVFQKALRTSRYRVRCKANSAGPSAEHYPVWVNICPTSISDFYFFSSPVHLSLFRLKQKVSKNKPTKYKIKRKRSCQLKEGKKWS